MCNVNSMLIENNNFAHIVIEHVVKYILENPHKAMACQTLQYLIFLIYIV